ncbi:MAG: PAS domain S-box protein [Gemmatimonadota bacterium]
MTGLRARSVREGYTVAVVVTIVAAAICYGFGLYPTVLTPLLGAVIISAWYGGARPGLLATTLATLSTLASLSGPLAVPGAGPFTPWGLLRFAFLGFATSLVCGILHDSREAAESTALENARLYRSAEEAQIELEEAAAQAQEAMAEAEVSTLHAEEALRHQNELLAMLDSMLVSAPVGLAFIDRDLRYVRVNARLARLKGLEPEAIVGRALGESRESWATQLRPRVQEVLRRGVSIREIELTEATDSGDQRTLSINLEPVRVGGPDTSWVGMTVEDVTERVRSWATLAEGERRFRLLTDSAPMLVWMSDTGGRRYYFNETWLKFTGRTMEQESGSGWTEGIHPDDLRLCLETYHASAAAQHAFEMDYRLRRNDGTYRWILDCGVPRHTTDGKFLGFIGSCVDVTERKEAERFGAQFAAIVASSDDAIISKLTDGTILTWNAGAERIFGYTAEEMVGLTVFQLIPDELHAEEHDILRRVSSGEPVQHYETTRRRKDGALIDISLSVSPIRDESGQVIGASAIKRDITGQKRLERELRLANETLEERVAERTASLAAHARELGRSNAELEQFAYVASHDLQEPLRMVINFSELLAHRYRGRLGPDADEFISHALGGAQRMRTLITGLLEYSRTRTQPLALVPTSLTHVALEIRNVLQPVIQESGASVTIDPLPTVEADPVQMAQLLQNLITNALKFRGAEPPRIHIWQVAPKGEARERAEEVRIGISDNGIGVPPEYAEKIFGMFQRLHGRDVYPGTGIGLAVCRQIVERHGGRIWVEAVEGGGSAFFFTLQSGGPPGLRAT